MIESILGIVGRNAQSARNVQSRRRHPIHIQSPARNASENPADAWTAAMAVGDFEAAWRVSDRVLAGRKYAVRDDANLPYHLRWVWDGRPFDNKRILVRCYHGLGDTLQFCRFLSPLRRRALHLTIEAQPELVGLLETLEGPDEIIPFDPARPRRQSECDMEIMELSHALRLAPSPGPYLSPAGPPISGGAKVGLCWQSTPTWLPERSLPASLVAMLLKCPNIEFVSLQNGAAAIPGLADDCPTSISETARRIAGLDLVISVDTMVAHLTGALGVPLWLLLKAQPDWRWLEGGNGSLWYTGVTKHRQPAVDDWDTPIRTIISGLEGIMSEGTLEALRSSRLA